MPKPTGVALPDSPLLTVEEAARYLRASTVWTVRRLIYLGRLPYVKVGKRFNIRRTDLDSWIAANSQREGKAA